ncbi:MAG: outer membrane beta-barrel protein [Gemmatimonadaceae bacterium]
MKRALLALALFSAEPALAQDEDPRGFIGLDIGPSVPFGNFADASPSNARGGRAFPGYNSTLLNLGWRFGEHFGVAAAVSYGEYVLRNGGDDDWWQMASLTVGPMYSRRLGSRTALDLKAMAGWTSLLPVVDSRASDNDQGNSLGIDLRAAVRYQVFSRWAAFAEGGVQAANVTFPNGGQKDYRTMITGFGIAYRPGW